MKYGQSFLFLEFMHFVCPSCALFMVMSYMCSPFVFNFSRAHFPTPLATRGLLPSRYHCILVPSHILLYFSHLSHRAFPHSFGKPCNAVPCVCLRFLTTVFSSFGAYSFHGSCLFFETRYHVAVVPDFFLCDSPGLRMRTFGLASFICCILR